MSVNLFLARVKKRTNSLAHAAVLSFLMLGPASAEILPVSDDRYLQEADLVGLNKRTLRIARNEIFARHGYLFNSSDLKLHFSQYSWYRPYTKNVALSRIEQSNIEFIKNYENSAALRARLQNSTVNTDVIVVQTAPTKQKIEVVVKNDTDLAKLQDSYDSVVAKIAALEAVMKMQLAKAAVTEAPKNVHNVAIKEITRKIRKFNESKLEFENTSAQKYQTSIKPTIDYSASSPRELSRNFPKIPWYKPQYVEEIGEFWLEPLVTDVGDLEYVLQFVEPDQASQNVAATFTLTNADAEIVQAALAKTYDWSEVAKANNLRDRYQKEADCTPTDHCVEKVQGNTSTQVDFLVFEGGAMGARLIRNKGSYKEGYGISIESAALLSSYFDFMIDAGKQDLNAGTRTTKELDALFD
jgi:hypothetical protein